MMIIGHTMHVSYPSCFMYSLFDADNICDSEETDACVSNLATACTKNMIRQSNQPIN
jgi:hypothetical protein